MGKKTALFLILITFFFNSRALAHEALTGIKKVSIKIHKLDQDTRKVGLNPDFFEELIKGNLEDLGIKISTTEIKPQVELRINVIKMFGGYASSYRLQVRDWALSPKDPNTKIYVTTWEKGGILSGRKKQMQPKLKEAVQDMLEAFAQGYIKSA